ncbi:hypothetical protein [Streptomyces sp. HNM0574]|uniref:hypothetical protein n=1 Tax=Streptomyces sp. HNM0574 TaxID=2714954 RepID=UPI00146E356A|nr:hypothetical protein [Streptomyces sp. HNM0574]NLU70636.1 hypothetical protein [Streptomyces sp. HNM0574]
MRQLRLLIDIDGVLIPFPDPDGSAPAGHVHHHVVPSGRDPSAPVPIWLHPAHGPMLRAVTQTSRLAPRWCTSWRHDASRHIAPLLGLPPWPHLNLPRPQINTSHPNGYLWKRDFVDAWLDDAPAIWIDDDFTALDRAWATQRTAHGRPTLLVQPDPHIGLLPKHLTSVERWASGFDRTQARSTRKPREYPVR